MQAFLGRSSCTLFYVYQMSKQLYSVFSLLPSAFFPSLFPSSFTLSFFLHSSLLLCTLFPSSTFTFPFFLHSSLLLRTLFPSFPLTLSFSLYSSPVCPRLSFLCLSMCMSISCLLLGTHCVVSMCCLYGFVPRSVQLLYNTHKKRD